MSVVYVVHGSCGDYYCDGGHLVAVCDTRAEADRIVEGATHGDLYRWPEKDRWNDLRVVEVTLNTHLPEWPA